VLYTWRSAPHKGRFVSQTSLEQFQRYAGRKCVQSALLREWIADEGAYQDFVSQLYEDIDDSIYALQASRELRQADGEDRITQDILFGLSQKGYQATHDSKTGGHVDLSIRLGTHSWIGEAKKDGNFQEGFLQLTTRYVQASGNFSHDHGGLLLYLVKVPDALKTLNSWRNKLAKDGANCSNCMTNRLAFFSTHKLEGPGTEFTIRSMAVSLFHKPLDKSARNTVVKQAARKAAKKSTGRE
jgi:hypothetical protein